MAEVLALRPHPGPVDRGKRVLIAAYGQRSSYDLYRAYAKHFRLSFSDYCAVVLARFHGLRDPWWIHVGELDLSNVMVQPPLSEAADEMFTARARVSPEDRTFYDARAAELGVSQRIYLGTVMSLIHGEPPVAILSLDSRQRQPAPVLRFPPSVRRVSDDVYEAVAMADA